MVLFFSRISKPCVHRVVNARFFSSLPQSPCFLVGLKKLGESPDGGRVVNHRLFDSATEEVVTSCEKVCPKMLIRYTLVGASQGWIGTKRGCSVDLTDLYKPRVSSPTILSLPCLCFFPSPSSSYTTALSLSSSPNQDQDLTVAAKFHGTHLSICKPFWDSEWTHIEIPIPLLPISDLMYSKRDKAFYFTSVTGLYMGSLHLSNKENNNKLKYQEVRLRNHPKIPETGWELLDRCFTSNHLVESPSGELFFVKWYTQCNHKEDKDGREVEGIDSKTKRFMVFREDEKSKDFCYTQDIGDLCIFLGKSEAFCLSASMYPGLNPNSIYYIGHGRGSYDLASDMVCSFDPPRTPESPKFAPYWISSLQ